MTRGFWRLRLGILEARLRRRIRIIEPFVPALRTMLKRSGLSLILTRYLMMSLWVSFVISSGVTMAGWLVYTEFFYRTHDPTTLNRQGGDTGTRTSSFCSLGGRMNVARVQNIDRLFSITRRNRSLLQSGLQKRFRISISRRSGSRSSLRSWKRDRGGMGRIITSCTCSSIRMGISARLIGSIGNGRH